MATVTNGDRATRRSNVRRRRNSTSSNVNTGRRTNQKHNENDENDRSEFIASFQLDILTASSPILVRNGINKLGNKCYSAKMVKKYFENSNPHGVNIRIKQIWKVQIGQSTLDSIVSRQRFSFLFYAFF